MEAIHTRTSDQPHQIKSIAVWSKRSRETITTTLLYNLSAIVAHTS